MAEALNNKCSLWNTRTHAHTHADRWTRDPGPMALGFAVVSAVSKIPPFWGHSPSARFLFALTIREWMTDDLRFGEIELNLSLRVKRELSNCTERSSWPPVGEVYEMLILGWLMQQLVSESIDRDDRSQRRVKRPTVFGLRGTRAPTAADCPSAAGERRPRWPFTLTSWPLACGATIATLLLQSSRDDQERVISVLNSTDSIVSHKFNFLL